MRRLSPTRLESSRLAAARGAAACRRDAPRPTCAEGPANDRQTTIVGTPCADTIRAAARHHRPSSAKAATTSLFGQRGNDSLFGGEGQRPPLRRDRRRPPARRPRRRPALRAASAPTRSTAKAATTSSAATRRSTAIGDIGRRHRHPQLRDRGDAGLPERRARSSNDAGFPAGAEGAASTSTSARGFANDGLAPSGGGVDERSTATRLRELRDRDRHPVPRLHRRHRRTAETIYGGGGADVIDGERRRRHRLRRRRGRRLRRRRRRRQRLRVAATRGRPARTPATIAVGVMAPQRRRAAGPLPDRQRRRRHGELRGRRPHPGAGRAVDASPSAGSPSGRPFACPTEPPDSVLLAGLDGNDTPLRRRLPGDDLGRPARRRRRRRAHRRRHRRRARRRRRQTTSSAPAAATTRCPTTAAPTTSTPGRATTSSSPTRSATATCSTAAPIATTPTGRTSTPAVAIDMARTAPAWSAGGGAAELPERQRSTIAAGRSRTSRARASADVLLGDAGPNQLLGPPGRRHLLRRRRQRLDPRQLRRPEPDPTRRSTAAQASTPPWSTTPRTARRVAGRLRVGRRARPEQLPPARHAARCPSPTAADVDRRPRRHRRRATGPRRGRASPTGPPGVSPTPVAGAAVAFAFAANEAGARFRCKLDRGRSPLPLPPRLQGRRRRPHLPRLRHRRRRQSRPLPGRLRLPRPPAASGRWSRSRRSPRADSASASASTGSAQRDRRDHELGDAIAGLDPKVSAGSVLSSRTRTSPR